MGLADAFENVRSRQRTTIGCQLSRALAALPPDDAALLETEVYRGSMSGERVADAVAEVGIDDFGPQTVYKHRNGGCVSCRSKTDS